LLQERIERIERWQALHPKPELAASPEVAAADAELRAMIVAEYPEKMPFRTGGNQQCPQR
jgi:hypothetical protein